MNLEQITKQVCNLSRAAGLFIQEEAAKFTARDIQIKGRNNFVTYVDKESERRLVSELGKIIPGSGFITEEDTVEQSQKKFTWIIDPLDGTTNFIHHLPIFSISIALMHKQKIIAGVIYEINNDECFYGWEGGGAFLNEKAIKVSETKKLDQAFLATGFPYYDYSHMDNYLALFRESLEKARGIRRMGSAAVDLAYVACGRFDGFFEYGLNPWDIAAGAFIIKQAGGQVVNFKNGTNFLFEKEIVSTNGHIHHEFMTLVRNCFG
ncbi:MAG: inositol monophosphatase family protein [Bacteroidota bacterium]|nr:inositol monophosphatase family protein [Bacteroidota bacterium]